MEDNFLNYREFIKIHENRIITEATENIKQYLVESSELSPETEKDIDEALDRFMKRYNELKEQDLSFEEIESEMIKEGTLMAIIGGLTGFALGKTVGKAVARVLGVEKGFFYDLLTSRMFGAAMGAVMGKRI
jgi:hypothetical protein